MTRGGEGLRPVYAQKGLAGIPRLLTLMDRNELSPTFGCMDREFWLCRSELKEKRRITSLPSLACP